jgi:N-sulfoglucosamine sulfohydrolase
LLARHDRAQPLCLIVCSHSPHVYWPENEGYEPAALRLPPYLLDTHETRVARTKYLTDVTWMDAQLGQVMESLEKHGYGDALLMFTADQGAQFPFAKWNLYDAGVRVPLLIRWPGKITPGRGSNAMVSLVDLLPTLIDAAGETPPGGLDGQSFLPVILGQTDSHHRQVFASHTGDGQMNRSPMRCVRTDRYKYILNLAPQNVYRTHIDGAEGPDGRDYWDSWVRRATVDSLAAKAVDRYQHRPGEELYDLAEDPWELKNLAVDPAHAQTLAEMRRQLKQWRVQQGESLNRVPMPEDARAGDVPYAK